MSGAPYQWNDSLTNDETYSRTIELLFDDAPVPVDEYSFEYSVKGCVSLLLNETSGITKDVPSATITITPGIDYRFPVGQYPHGLRVRHIESGSVIQVSDGYLTVTDGNF